MPDERACRRERPRPLRFQPAADYRLKERMIRIRKLAALDMAWLGPRVILAEYALGIVLPLALGVVSIRSGLAGGGPGWALTLGIWLVGIAANYVPLFIYAVLITKAGTVRQEGGPELAHARRYGLQQAMLLVPALVLVVAVIQELLARRASR